jgi:hypothetical protein
MFIKRYKGFDIFLSNSSDFFTDVINNSDDINKKTFNSKKLLSLEKAIDRFLENKDTNSKKEYFYQIIFFNSSYTIKKLNIVSKIGKRIFFDDSTDSNSINRRGLFAQNIEKDNSFIELKAIFEKINRIQDEINMLVAEQKMMQKIAQNAFKNLKKYQQNNF